MTEKSQPTKCKGSAFVEFTGYDHMKTCLKLFHHSTFDDGKSAPRKINVELTYVLSSPPPLLSNPTRGSLAQIANQLPGPRSVGGGGNTKNRKAKITEKNAKLNEERVRRMQEEEKAKLTKAAQSSGVDESAIHPSRRRFVPGAQ
jgi:nucleolar protein 6